MATHSNILAWRIPWTEEPGGLQSMEPNVTEQQTLSLYFHIRCDHHQSIETISENQ